MTQDSLNGPEVILSGPLSFLWSLQCTFFLFQGLI